MIAAASAKPCATGRADKWIADTWITCGSEMGCAAAAGSRWLADRDGRAYLCDATAWCRHHRDDWENLMSPVSLLLNLFWIVFGVLWMAVAWIVAALILRRRYE